MHYIVRNDLTGAITYALSHEARLYAIGGAFDWCYSVFRPSSSPVPLTVFDF